MRPAGHGIEAKSALPCPSGYGLPRLARSIPALALLLTLKASAQEAQPIASSLPDSPGATWTAMAAEQASAQQPQPPGQNPAPTPGPTAKAPKPCPATPHRSSYPRFHRDPCDPYRPFIDLNAKRLTSEQKGWLAVHDFTDPFNLLTVVGTSAFTIGTDSHSAFGPGMRGFGLNVGTSLAQDATGEAIGTFAVCSIFHQDPRYFRMPHAKPLRRLWHAISQVGVAESDDRRLIPNYSNFITSVAGAVIANQYVPGLATDPASTTERILTGFLTEPIGPIIAEFLPDVASKIHVRVVVVQRILNQIATQPQP
jgi:hypothetical protein